MYERFKAIVTHLRTALSRRGATPATASSASVPAGSVSAGPILSMLVGLCALGGLGYTLYLKPPLHVIGTAEVGLRVNRMTGAVTEWRDGTVLVLPGLHELRIQSLGDQTYRPVHLSRADGEAPVQSIEGLSFGADLAVRYAIDPRRVATFAGITAEHIADQVVAPVVEGAVYRILARYTVREIFSTKRSEIQTALEAELKSALAADGLVLRSARMGKVDLPADYKRGMETLLAEELATQKMRYTLELLEKRVRETALQADAEKVRREKQAEAAGREQVIAARAQEEAMKHVLPLKERQIEQRKLEAEAEKASRMKVAEGEAMARRIEAEGEADARQKLADAEAYRLDRIGKVNAEQMQREGELVTRHPLLIQRTLAEKLSDKLQVIIAAPQADGGFIADKLLGLANRGAPTAERAQSQAYADPGAN